MEPKVIDAEFVEIKDTAMPTKSPVVESLESASIVADKLGAKHIAEVTEAIADIARKAPQAFETIKRDGKPVLDAVNNLWKTAEKHGIVGRKPPHAWAKK